MQKLIKILLIFLMVTLTLAAPGRAILGSVAVIRQDPASVSLIGGQSTQIAIRVEDVTNLWAFDLEVRFNTSQLEVTSAVIGSFLDQGIKISSVDNVNGIVTFANAQLSSSSPRSGSGDLILITVKALKTLDEVHLNITSAELSDRDGYLIPCQIVNSGGYTLYLPLITN
jgi:hypothetical protein